MKKTIGSFPKNNSSPLSDLHTLQLVVDRMHINNNYNDNNNNNINTNGDKSVKNTTKNNENIQISEYLLHHRPRFQRLKYTYFVVLVANITTKLRYHNAWGNERGITRSFVVEKEETLRFLFLETN